MNTNFATRSLSILATLASAALFTISHAQAQEKHHVSYQAPAENTKYLQQYVIDAGDVKGHQVRIYEIKKTYPKEAFVLNGVNVVEEWIRGY